MASHARSIDVARLIDSRPLGPFNYKLIVLSWLITVFDGFDMQMIAFTAPYMRDELHLTTGQLGEIFSAGTFGAMIGSFLFAYLGDQIGRRRAILIAAFTFGVLTFATGFATSYAQLIVLRFADGIAIGGMLPLAWALNIEFVPNRYRASVVTLIMVGYSLGSASAGPISVHLAGAYGWQAMFFFGGAGTIVSALLLLWGLPESLRHMVAKHAAPSRIAATLRRAMPDVPLDGSESFHLSDETGSGSKVRLGQLFEGRLRYLTPLLWIAYLASSMGIFFSSSWGPIVLEALDFPRSTAAYVSSITGAAGAALGLVLMRFTDRVGPIAVAFYPLLAVPVLLVVGLGGLAPAMFLPFAIVGSALVGGGHQGIISITGVFYPSSVRASGAGVASFVAKFGAIAGPLLGGVILASGMPVIRSYAILAFCPALLGIAALGIHRVVRGRAATDEVPIPEPVPAS